MKLKFNEHRTWGTDRTQSMTHTIRILKSVSAQSSSRFYNLVHASRSDRVIVTSTSFLEPGRLVE